MTNSTEPKPATAHVAAHYTMSLDVEHEKGDTEATVYVEHGRDDDSLIPILNEVARLNRLAFAPGVVPIRMRTGK